MELLFPVKPSRVVAAALLFGCFLVGIRETRSPLALAVRRGNPWPFWTLLTSTASAPELFLGVYVPRVPAVELVSVGAVPRGGPDEAWEKISPLLPQPLRGAAPDLLLSAPSPGAQGLSALPPVACAEWMERRGRGLAFLKELFRAAAAGDWERMRLDWELSRVPAADIAGAFKPPSRIAGPFYAAVLSPSFWKPATGEPLLAEVLNASESPGLAARVTKVLRLRGVDVVNFGNASSTAAGAVIYDRDGRIGNARRVQEALEDPDARVVTELWERPWLDVSLVLK